MTTNDLMIELVGHRLDQALVVMGWSDDHVPDIWTQWSCRCGFEAVGEADLAPLIQRWHDESVGPVAAA